MAVDFEEPPIEALPRKRRLDQRRDSVQNRLMNCFLRGAICGHMMRTCTNRQTDSDVKLHSKRFGRPALFQPEGVRGAHVRSSPCGDEGRREGSGGKEECGAGDGSGIGGGYAGQLRLDEFTESGDARQREGDAGGDHGDGIAQHEAQGRGGTSTAPHTFDVGPLPSGLEGRRHANRAWLHAPGPGDNRVRP